MTLFEASVRSLSEEVHKLLVEHGWTVGRRTPLDKARASLERESAPLHAYAEALLRSFDGLLLYHPGTGRWIKVSATDTCDFLDEGDLPYVQALFSKSACPVALGAYSPSKISVQGGLGSGGTFPDCWFFVAEDGRWLCIDIFWGGAWFFPNMDAALRFALFRDEGEYGRVPLTREQCPPGTWADP